MLSALLNFVALQEPCGEPTEEARKQSTLGAEICFEILMVTLHWYVNDILPVSIVLFIICTCVTLHAARNALVVFVAAMLGYCLKLQPWFKQQISLIDYDNGKLPPIQVPDPTSDVCSVSVLYMIVQLLSTD